MDQINLLIIATVISLFISLFLAFFLITVKTKHKISNILFAVFLLITAIDSSEPLFNTFVDGPSSLGMLRNTFAFLQIPVFYLYVVSVCYSDFKLKTKHLLHLIPFFSAILILLPRFYFADAAAKINFLQHAQIRPEIQFNHILIHTQIIIYLIVIFSLLRKVKKLYLENYAGTSINSYKWLFQFTIVLTVLYLTALLKNIFKFSEYQYISDGIKIGLLSSQLIVVCWYLYKALNNPGLFRNIDSRLKLVSDIVSEKEESITTPAENEVSYEIELTALREYMIKEKPFLNPSLTIQDISDGIKIPVRELSLLINHKLGQHFFDFINSYRIENAMILLKDAAKSKVTILEILYEVGFNSKSSFNTAFKKHTGVTPTNYRKQL